MRGITVTLHELTQTGTDEFNNPIYSQNTVMVDDVLVGEPTTDEVTSSIDLYGKKIEFVLAIPKGDTHSWEHATVEFFGRTYQTVGFTVQGVEANVPTRWHKKVRVSRVE